MAFRSLTSSLLLLSCFYAISFCAANAGIYTPISLLLVVLLLYCFRSVYGEVGTALPLNGGCYTLLLNVSVRGVAAFAACLTLLSYVATAVVSGDSAVNYILNLLKVEKYYDTYEEIGTIGLLGFFALLSLLGVSESAVVALVIFGIHMVTIVILLVACFIHFVQHPEILATNWANRDCLPAVSHDPIKAILFGFSGALLGVTGFETSANFIEQQKKGVFPLTLRNMWVCVLAINPLMGFLALCTLSIDKVANPSNTALLGMMGAEAGGVWLEYLVSCDAALVSTLLPSFFFFLLCFSSPLCPFTYLSTQVLAGAVLTAYVGVIGLIRRLALDRCMPMFFIAENKWRRTNHWTILSFFLTCSSLYELLSSVGDSSGSGSDSSAKVSFFDIELLTASASASGSNCSFAGSSGSGSDSSTGGGNTNTQNLGKVYTLSFLCVMALFALGNMILKYKRSRLPRTIVAKWPMAIISFFGVTFGLLLTILLDVSTLQYFFLYYGITLLIVGVMFLRIRIIKFVIYAIHGIFNPRFGNTRVSGSKFSSPLLLQYLFPLIHLYTISSAFLSGITEFRRGYESLLLLSTSKPSFSFPPPVTLLTLTKQCFT
jgi:amino acid transporter